MSDNPTWIPQVGDKLMVTERVYHWIIRVRPDYHWSWDGPFDVGAIVTIVEIDDTLYHIQNGDMRFQAIELDMAAEMRQHYLDRSRDER